MARHLETCEACRQLVEELREIARAAATLDPITPPARVWARIEKDNQAINESRAAVGAEPASEQAQYSLIENIVERR